MPSRAQEAVPEGIAEDHSVTGEEGSAVDLLSSVPFHLSLNLQGGYDTNSRTTQSAGGSSFVHGGVTLSYESPGDHPHVGVRTGASLAYYPDSTAGRNTSLNLFLNLSVKHSISVRLSLTGSVDVAYRTEPDFSSDVGVENQRANYVHMSDAASLTYHWYERFSTVTSETFRLIKYDNSSIGTSQDRIDNAIGQEFRFNLSDNNTLVGEYRFQIVEYDNFPRDSTTQVALVGLDRGFTSQLKLTARGGATFRAYNDNGDQTNPHFEGSLVYSGAHNSSLNWSTRYGVEEPNAKSAVSRTTFRTGVQLSYGITARIGATLAGYYHHDENRAFDSGVISPGQSATGFSEDVFDVSVGAHYTINTRFSCNFSFQRSEISSSRSARDYSRNRYSAGLTFTY